MRADDRQISEPVNRPQQMVSRNMVIKTKSVEQRPLSFLPYKPQPGILANRFMVSFVLLSGVPGAIRYFGERQYRIRIAISVSLEPAA